jgi:outer membrane protein OmpA-like peptidoglycan-associated protein
MWKFLNRLIIIARVFLLLLPSTLFLFSQNPKDTLLSFPFKVGVAFDYDFLFHSAYFKKLPGIPNCCPRFERGDGNGFRISVLGEYNISAPISVGVRLFYQNFNGTLGKIEPTTLIYQGLPLEGEFEHKIISKFTNMGIEPYISFNPISSLYLSIGVNLGYSFSTWFDQAETIVKPQDIGTFLDSNGNDTHSRIRNQFSGKIPEASRMHQSIVTTISYELPLNKRATYLLAPFIGYSYGLNELVRETSWKANSLFAGLGIKYQPKSIFQPTKFFRQEFKLDTIKIFAKDIQQDTIFKLGSEHRFTQTLENDTAILEIETRQRTDTIFIREKFVVTGNISLVGIDSVGNEIPEPEILVEEFVFNRLDPLLNYIFFSENSSEIPNRYKLLTSEQTEQFVIDSLFYDSTIEIYYNILNIVGKRLRTHSKATIRLVGCNSNTGVEKGNLDLSRKRAESIKNYLVEVWNIAPERIIIEANNLPTRPSTPTTEPEKIQENQRVEIYSDTYEILEPVFVRKVERKVSPERLRFKLDLGSGNEIARITVVASQNNTDTLFAKDFEPSFPNLIPWDISQNQDSVPKLPVPIDYAVNIIGRDGSRVTFSEKTKPLKVITIEKKRSELIGDFELEQYSLILFDFDKATIEDNNLKIIEFIKGRLKPESQIEIEGFTDKTGDSEYNRLLSERRAIATRTALNRLDSKAIGFGESKLLFDNHLPEGRFYCRTIIVKVKNPIRLK